MGEREVVQEAQQEGEMKKRDKGKEVLAWFLLTAILFLLSYPEYLSFVEMNAL